jgi:hypothetical protein
MTLQTLKDEITNDLLNRGYDEMTADQVAISLNTKDRSVSVPIPAQLLVRWAAGGSDRAANESRMINLEKARDGLAPFDALPDTVRGVAGAALKLLDISDSELDPDDPEVEALVNALVAAGVITANDKAALLTYGQRSVSRAEELDITPRPVKPGHVINVRGH